VPDTDSKEPRGNNLIVLETANRVALNILASRTGVEALQHIAEAARTLANARYAALGVARTDGQGLSEFITAGLSSEAEAVIGARPKGSGILGLLLARKEPLRIDSLADHPHSVGFPPHHPQMTSFLGVPILRGETVVGSLYLTEKQTGGVFTAEDEAAVLALGSYAAVAIYHLHLMVRQRTLLSGLLAAQEEERRAVAYDLHDGLTQYVMASHAHFESSRHAQTSGSADRANREFEKGMQYLKEAVVESRRLINGLRSLALDDLGLAGALEQLLMENKAWAGWEDAEFVHNIADVRFHKTLETAVYRIAQEALTNARKHAQTRRVRLTLLYQAERAGEPPCLKMEIRDWGVGFVPERREESFAGVGLHSMRERVYLQGGTYALHSTPGAGTIIQASLPITETEPNGVENNLR
jgi:signal transduction histidine kinase